MPAGSWKSIAVVVDPLQKVHPALQKAAVLAESSGARLTLLNTFVMPQPTANVAGISASEIIDSALRERRRKLEARAVTLRRRPRRPA